MRNTAGGMNTDEECFRGGKIFFGLGAENCQNYGNFMNCMLLLFDGIQCER